MDISSLTFTQVWAALRANCKPPQKVRSWTVIKGYLGDTMTIISVDSHAVSVDAPGAQSLQVVPQEDFEAVFQIWQRYKTHKVQRQEIRDITRYSKYVISILHWLETEV